MKKLLILIFSIISFASFSQSILMSNGLNTVCTGQFESSTGFGSGGVGTPGYTNNENFVMTFCPGVGGNIVSLNFASCVLGTGDVLTVYNGSTTAAPILGVFDATNPLIGIISALQSTNPGGCITFQFVSDSAGIGNGWTASISCIIPCQPFEIMADSVYPDTTLGGFVDVCDGDTAFLQVIGNYFNNNLNYNQTDSNTTFYWYLDTVLIDSGSAITFPPDTSGAFLLQVFASDTIGCQANFNYNFWIRVATDPDFTPSYVQSDTICFGDTTFVHYGAISTPWSNTDTTLSTPTTFLPDGTGSNPGVYNNTLTFSKFPTGDTISSLSDIDRFWVNMEHSFIGDLTISMSCPNGSSAVLKNFPGGGGRWLGEACDNNNTPTPGIGYYYEWLPTGNNLTDMVAHSGLCTGCPVVSNPCNTIQNGTTLQSDSYNSFQSMTNLIGCPLNGTWTLTIIDQWGTDNGFLFSWGVQLDSALYPNTVISYDPGIDTITLTPHNNAATVIATTSDSISLLPLLDDTTYCYTVDVLDGFGCWHDSIICFFVRDMCDPVCYTPVSPVFGETKVSCPFGVDGELYAYPDVSQMPMPWTYIWTDDLGVVLQTTLSSSIPDTIIGLEQGMYHLEIIDGNGCSSTWNKQLGTINSMQVNVIAVGQTSCATSTCDAVGSAVVFYGTGPYSYAWSGGDTNAMATTLCAGLNYLFVTDSKGCVDTSTFTVTSPNPISVSAFGTTTICISDSALIGCNAVGGTPPYGYDWNSGFSSSQIFNVGPVLTQGYQVIVTDANNCPPDTADVLVTVRPPLSLSFNFPDTLCPGDTVFLLASATGGDGFYSYSWEQGFGNTAGVQVPVTVSQYYDVTVTDACGTTPETDSIWVQVGGFPPLKVGITPDDTICLNDPFFLFAQGIGGDGNFHYDWDNGLGKGQTHAVKPTQSTIYTVTVTDECFTPAGIGNVAVTVGNFENFNAWVDTNQNCDPGTFVFGFDTLNPSFSYEMNFGDGFRFVNPMLPIERTFTEDGCHDVNVRLTTELGCETKKSYPCLFSVLPTPIANFDFNPHKPDVKEFGVDFWDKSSGATIWNWYSNNSLLSNEEQFSYLFPDSGIYNILLVVENEFGCFDSVDTDLPLAFVSSYFVPTAFTPNGDGNNDVFNLVGEGIQDRDFELIIFDRWGGEVLNSTNRSKGWNGLMQNSGEALMTGMYSYSITFRIHTGRKITEFGQVNLLK